MRDREQERAQLVPSMARLMRSRDLLTELAAVGAGSRSATVVVALPDDTMDYVWERFEEAPWGPAVLGVQEQGSWRVALIWRAGLDVAAPAQCDSAEVSDAAEVSMFLDALDSASPVLVRRRPSLAARRLLDRGEPQPI